MEKAKNNRGAKRNGTDRSVQRTNAQSAGNGAARPSRRETSTEDSWMAGPQELVQRFGAELDRVLEDLGVRRGLVSNLADQLIERPSTWSPQVEVSEQAGQLVLRVDLPGLNKDEIKVDLSDDAITIEGERKAEREENQKGYYRSERSYGCFHRRISLPTGAQTDTATAEFRNGVLEIAMALPEMKQRSARKIKIAGDSAPAKARAAGS